ncbi:MAG: hypothetical protein ABL900_03970 [Burkholderiaceae bacterium]
MKKPPEGGIFWNRRTDLLLDGVDSLRRRVLGGVGGFAGHVFGGVSRSAHGGRCSTSGPGSATGCGVNGCRSGSSDNRSDGRSHGGSRLGSGCRDGGFFFLAAGGQGKGGNQGGQQYRRLHYYPQCKVSKG